jgi:putative two-component system hydrogenase maturation factor HypX/HoxX
MLNPHYRTMGLFGSEYWTYVLPRRVGDEQAQALTTRCEPVSAARAANLGLVDEVSAADRAEFEAVVLDYAAELAAHPRTAALLDRKRVVRDGEERHRPLDTYRVRELAEMSQDIFDNRNGFAQARRAFLTNQAPAAAAARLPVPRFPGDENASTEPRGRWSALTAKLAAAWR